LAQWGKNTELDVIQKPPEDPSMPNVITLKRLHWADHIQLMGGKRIPKRVQRCNNTGRRHAGETRKRWVWCFENRKRKGFLKREIGEEKL
jgi:hypothetical protein